MARASASVVGSGTVGPEPIAEGSSPGTSEIAMVTSLRRIGMARQPSALDAREMFAHRVDLADVGARAQQRARDRLFVFKRYPGRRRDPVGRGAARHQHQHQVVRVPHYRRAPARGRRLPGRRRRGSDGRLRSCVTTRSRPAVAVARHRDAGKAVRGQASTDRDKSLPPLRPWNRRPCRRRARSAGPRGGGGSSGGRQLAGCAAATAVRNRSARKARRGLFIATTIAAHRAEKSAYNSSNET